MTLYEFIILNLEERAEYIWENGTFLATDPAKGNLYSVGDFFAEILYDEDRNMISDIKCFKTTTKLAPYFDLVDLHEISKV